MSYHPQSNHVHQPLPCPPHLRHLLEFGLSFLTAFVSLQHRTLCSWFCPRYQNMNWYCMFSEILWIDIPRWRIPGFFPTLLFIVHCIPGLPMHVSVYRADINHDPQRATLSMERLSSLLSNPSPLRSWVRGVWNTRNHSQITGIYFNRRGHIQSYSPLRRHDTVSLGIPLFILSPFHDNEHIGSSRGPDHSQSAPLILNLCRHLHAVLPLHSALLVLYVSGGRALSFPVQPPLYMDLLRRSNRKVQCTRYGSELLLQRLHRFIEWIHWILSIDLSDNEIGGTLRFQSIWDIPCFSQK